MSTIANSTEDRKYLGNYEGIVVDVFNDGTASVAVPGVNMTLPAPFAYDGIIDEKMIQIIKESIQNVNTRAKVASPLIGPGSGQIFKQRDNSYVVSHQGRGSVKENLTAQPQAPTNTTVTNIQQTEDSGKIEYGPRTYYSQGEFGDTTTAIQNADGTWKIFDKYTEQGLASEKRQLRSGNTFVYGAMASHLRPGTIVRDNKTGFRHLVVDTNNAAARTGKTLYDIYGGNRYNELLQTGIGTYSDAKSEQYTQEGFVDLRGITAASDLQKIVADLNGTSPNSLGDLLVSRSLGSKNNPTNSFSDPETGPENSDETISETECSLAERNQCAASSNFPTRFRTPNGNLVIAQSRNEFLSEFNELRRDPTKNVFSLDFNDTDPRSPNRTKSTAFVVVPDNSSEEHKRKTRNVVGLLAADLGVPVGHDNGITTSRGLDGINHMELLHAHDQKAMDEFLTPSFQDKYVRALDENFTNAVFILPHNRTGPGFKPFSTAGEGTDNYLGQSERQVALAHTIPAFWRYTSGQASDTSQNTKGYNDAALSEEAECDYLMEEPKITQTPQDAPNSTIGRDVPATSGPFSPPSIGSKVWVFFAEGNINCPVIWAYQLDNLASADNMGSWSTTSNVKAEIFQGNIKGKTHGAGIFCDENAPYGVGSTQYTIYNGPGPNLIQVDDGTLTEEMKFISSYNHFTMKPDRMAHFAGGENVEVTGLAKTQHALQKNTHTINHIRDYSIEGSLNEEASDPLAPLAHAVLKEMYMEMFEYVRLFDTWRALPDHLTSKHQEQRGSPAPCPVCNKFEAEYINSRGKTTSEKPRTTSANTEGGFLKSILGYYYNQITGDDFRKYCTNCGGSGITFGTEDGEWDSAIAFKKQCVQDLQKKYQDKFEFYENLIGSHNNKTQSFAGNWSVIVGGTLYSCPPIRSDEAGRWFKGAMIQTPFGPIPKVTPVPLVEPVAFPPVNGGLIDFTAGHTFNIKSGSGGMQLTTAGNMQQTASIYKGEFTSASITGKKGLMLDGSEGGTIITGDHILISPNKTDVNDANGDPIGSSKAMLVDGDITTSQNLLVAGGGHIEGNLTCNSMTMPSRPGATEFDYDTTKPEENNPTRGHINGIVSVPIMTGKLTIINKEDGTFVITEAILNMTPTGGEREEDKPVIVDPHTHPIILPNIEVVEGPRKVQVPQGDGTIEEEELEAVEAVRAKNMIYLAQGTNIPANTPIPDQRPLALKGDETPPQTPCTLFEKLS